MAEGSDFDGCVVKFQDFGFLTRFVRPFSEFLVKYCDFAVLDKICHAENESLVKYCFLGVFDKALFALLQYSHYYYSNIILDMLRWPKNRLFRPKIWMTILVTTFEKSIFDKIFLFLDDKSCQPFEKIKF